jgi:hypothetical protein
MQPKQQAAMAGAAARPARPYDLPVGALGAAGDTAPVATKEDAEQKPGAEQMNTNTSDCAANDADSKDFSNLQARAAQRGCALRPLAGGGYLMSQWSYSREVPDPRTVCSLLRRMGA